MGQAGNFSQVQPNERAQRRGPRRQAVTPICGRALRSSNRYSRDSSERACARPLRSGPPERRQFPPPFGGPITTADARIQQHAAMSDTNKKVLGTAAAVLGAAFLYYQYTSIEARKRLRVVRESSTGAASCKPRHALQAFRVDFGASHGSNRELIFYLALMISAFCAHRLASFLLASRLHASRASLSSRSWGSP